MELISKVKMYKIAYQVQLLAYYQLIRIQTISLVVSLGKRLYNELYNILAELNTRIYSDKNTH